MKTKLKYLIGMLLLVFVFCSLCSCQCTHEWQDATCTAPATCNLCGKTQGEANGHAYSESVTVQPTCMKEGTKLYTCTACEDSYTEPINKLEHTVANGICGLCNETIKGGFVMQPFCSYTTDCSREGGTEALYIYIPTGEGYIRYQVVHTVVPKIKSNTWRLGYVSHVNDALQNERIITDPGAEWEMAIELQGRVDFIGGLAHGDETFSSMKLTVDGKEHSASGMNFVSFDTLTVEVYSTGYDPNVAGREVLSHYKKLIFTKDGVRVEQRVEFKTDEVPKRVYFAMMPPLKDFTDHYYTNRDDTHKKIPAQASESGTDLNSLTLVGEDGFSFRMTVEKYSEGANAISIRDNGGGAYNKMYFSYNGGDHVSAGDVWETVTVYEITYKK